MKKREPAKTEVPQSGARRLIAPRATMEISGERVPLFYCERGQASSLPLRPLITREPVNDPD